MLEIKELTKIYSVKGGKETIALNNVNIVFPEVGMVFLLGKSGSGKSTLLNMIGGLDVPTSGEIIIKGRSSKTFKESDFDSYRNTFVGFIFQEYNILNQFSVEENLSIALQLQNKPKNDDKIKELLDLVELSSFAKRKPNTLSGGQKQRVAIARALIKDPEIILADEPTGALDSNTGKQILDTLKKSSKEKLVIVVSHDREFAEIYGDRIIELKDGEVIADISKEYIEPTQKGNLSFVGENTMIIKNGTKLEDDDLKMIGEYISKSDEEIIISNNSADVKKFKNESRINDSLLKEEFKDTKNDEIKHKEYSKENQTLIKSRLPIFNALRIGLSNLKLKPIRLLFTIIFSSLAFSLLGLVSTLTFYNPYEVLAKTLHESNCDYLPIEKEYIYSSKYRQDDYESINHGKTKMNDEDIKKFKDIYKEKAISYFHLEKEFEFVGSPFSHYFYQIESWDKGPYYQSNLYSLSDEIDNEQLIERLVIGNFPNKNDEIVITSFTAESLIGSTLYTDEGLEYIAKKIDDIVGKKVVTKIGKMNISGVIDVEDLIPVKYQVLKNSSTNKVETYSLQTEWAEYYSSSLITCGFVSKTFYKDYIDNHYEYKNIDVYKMDNVLISKYRLASEKRKYLGFDNKLIDEPLSKNGIYMSIDCYIQYLSKLITNNTSSFTNEEKQTINQFLEEFVLCYNTNNLSKEHDYILELDLLQKISNVLIDKQIGFNMLCIIDPFSKSTTEYDTFKILGLCDYGEYNSLEVNSMELINYLEIDRDSTFIYNSKYVKDKNAKYSGVFISTKGFSLNDFRSIINKSRKESKDNSYFVINHSADEAIFVEFSSFSEYRNVFLWAGIITGVFSIMLLSNFISLSITNKEHEIGILRAVGAKKSDIYKIFFFEALCIVLICLAIGIGVSNLVISVLNNLFASTFKIGFLVYGVPSFLFELFSAIFGLFASTALPVYSLSKKKPVDTIKSL